MSLAWQERILSALSSQQQLRTGIGQNGQGADNDCPYNHSIPGMRRALQSVILFEAKRCIEHLLPQVRPYQRKAAYLDQCHALVEAMEIIDTPSKAIEVMWRNTTTATISNASKRSMDNIQDLNRFNTSSISESIVAGTEGVDNSGRTTASANVNGLGLGGRSENTEDAMIILGEPLDAEMAWKRCKAIERELERLAALLRPFIVPGRSHAENVTDLVQSLYETLNGTSTDNRLSRQKQNNCSSTNDDHTTDNNRNHCSGPTTMNVENNNSRTISNSNNDVEQRAVDKETLQPVGGTLLDGITDHHVVGLYPFQWEYTHNHCFLAFRMYYLGDTLDPDFPTPISPRSVVIPTQRIESLLPLAKKHKNDDKICNDGSIECSGDTNWAAAPTDNREDDVQDNNREKGGRLSSSQEQARLVRILQSQLVTTKHLRQYRQHHHTNGMSMEGGNHNNNNDNFENDFTEPDSITQQDQKQDQKQQQRNHHRRCTNLDGANLGNDMDSNARTHPIWPRKSNHLHDTAHSSSTGTAFDETNAVAGSFTRITKLDTNTGTSHHSSTSTVSRQTAVASAAASSSSAALLLLQQHLNPRQQRVAATIEHRRRALAEVREHLYLLKEFRDVIDIDDLKRRKRELFLALPPAPPPSVFTYNDIDDDTHQNHNTGSRTYSEYQTRSACLPATTEYHSSHRKKKKHRK